MPTSEHPALVVTWLFFLQPVALGAKLVDLVEHPVEQRVGRAAGYSGMLKLSDVHRAIAQPDGGGARCQHE